MATTTSQLVLRKPVGSDQVNVTTDIADNMQKIDDAFNPSTGHSHAGTTGNGPQIGTSGIADSAITTAKIGANSVDGTKIALGGDAQGDVMYYNGTDWARLAAGTSGNFLKTQGAAANPVWAAAGGGVVQSAIAVGVTSGQSTTSTSYVDMTDMAVTLTVTANNHLLCWLYTSVDSTTAGNITTMGLSLDGAAEVREVSMQKSDSDYYQHALSTFNRYASVSGGSHTIKGRFKVGSGGANLELTQRALLVMEVTA